MSELHKSVGNTAMQNKFVILEDFLHVTCIVWDSISRSRLAQILLYTRCLKHDSPINWPRVASYEFHPVQLHKEKPNTSHGL